MDIMKLTDRNKYAWIDEHTDWCKMNEQTDKDECSTVLLFGSDRHREERFL